MFESLMAVVFVVSSYFPCRSLHSWPGMWKACWRARMISDLKLSPGLADVIGFLIFVSLFLVGGENGGNS